MFADTFEGIGGVAEFIVWAKRNRGEFYKLYARQLAADVTVAAPVVSVNIGSGPIIDAAQAAEAYRQILGNPAADLSGITFDAPAIPGALRDTTPAAIAYETPRADADSTLDRSEK